MRRIATSFAFLSAALLLGSTANAQPAKPAQPPATQPAPTQPAPTQPAPTQPAPDGTKPAEPPLVPPHADEPPASTQGADAARADERIRMLEERVAADERRLHRLDERMRFWRHFKIAGFVQPQFLVQSFNAAASPNLQANGQLPPGIGANDVTARPDGSTTNGTYFRMRRARLLTTYETDIMRFFLQLDAFPAGGIGPGIGTIVRNAEATGIARWSRDVRTEVTAGIFLTPFRAELLEYSLYRPFIERTWFVQNAFPLERDVGVHAKTVAIDERLVFDVGILNGQRLGERYFVETPDLNKSKDLVAALTFRFGPATVGVNGYLGKSQVVDGQQLRFKQFSRWAVNYQALVHHRLIKRLGETRLMGELTLSQNMDAGVIYPFAVPAIPVNIHDDVVNLTERALYVRFEQDLAPWLMAGYRYDFYTPDTTIANNARDTHAFLAVVRFSKNLRWMNELDWAIDNAHAFGTPPPSKHILTYSSVLQAGF